MAQKSADKKTVKRLITSVLLTLVVFAGVYYVFRNYDRFFALFQKDENVGAAQADPLNGTVIVLSDFKDSQTLAEVLTDAKKVGLRHYIVSSSFTLDKNCTTGSWNATSQVNDLFWNFLAQASSQKQQVYLGLAEIKSTCADITGNDKDAIIAASQKQFASIYTEIAKKGYQSVVLGAYIPQDAWVSDLAAYDSYYTNLAAVIKQQNSSLKVLISPYKGVQATYDATKARAAVQSFVASTEVDIIAPQTAMGTQGYSEDATKEYLMMWRDVVDRAQKGIELWASIDLYDKSVTNGRTVFTPAASTSIIERIDAVIPYVSTVTSFTFQHYMAQSNKLTNSSETYLISQKYSPQLAVSRYAARAGYLMHYQLKRDITEQKWSGLDLLVTFTDADLAAKTNVSIKVVYISTKGVVRTATTVKTPTAISTGKWSVKIPASDLALVDKEQRVALFIKAVTEKEKILQIE